MTLATGVRRVLVPLVILTVIGVALTPLATRPPGADNALADDFRTFMEPRLVALIESGHEVESLVTERSRNVLALRAESERIQALIGAIDAYLGHHQVPDWGTPAIDHYRTGVGMMLRAIDEANSALASFDFSAIPAMIPIFSDGVTEVETALRVLLDSAGDRSSYTVIGVT
jgi:hypothetical protein